MKFKVGDRVIWRVDGFEDDLGTISDPDDDEHKYIFVLMDGDTKTLPRHKKYLISIIEPWEIWKKLIAEIE